MQKRTDLGPASTAGLSGAEISRLTSRTHDLLVVGGGIHGLIAAYDAAQRGLAVALIDRDDFGAAASFNHLRTVHGGLRYLQRGDLRRLRESIRERRALAAIAPRLVAPLAFVMPTLRTPTRSRLAMRAAFLADALVGNDRNHGLGRPHHLPAGRIISRAECLRIFGDLAPDDTTGGALWHDYLMPEADRLTFAFAAAATARGACLANYLEATGPLMNGARFDGVRARDRLSGEEVEISASVTLNATGGSAGRLMAACGVARAQPMLKAMNLVTTRPAGPVALVAPGPTGASGHVGRALVLLPWRGRGVIGTSESDVPADPEDCGVSGPELSAFLDQVNATFPRLDLRLDEIGLVHRGIVPASARPDGRVALEGRYRICDHEADGVRSLISVRGVKYTTARLVAERAVDLAFRKLHRSSPPCRTAVTPLPGQEPADGDALLAELRTRAPELDREAGRHLLSTHGTGFRAVLDLVRENSAWGARIVPDQPVLRAAIVYAARHEKARTLADAVVRRTSLGSAGHPGPAAARVCAELLAAELGWDESRRGEEIAALGRFYLPIVAGSRQQAAGSPQG